MRERRQKAESRKQKAEGRRPWASGGRFQFSLADIFLATFVAGMTCLGVQQGARQDSAMVVVVLFFGIPMGIGSLLAGVKGLKFGFFMAAVASIVIVFVVLLVIVVEIVIGMIGGGFGGG